MAGIEKICEYSGDYEGSKMYGYKRNLIQVLPKYLKEFKYKKAVLVFFAEPLLVSYVTDKPNPFISVTYWKWRSFLMPRFWSSDYWIWRKFGMFYNEPSLVWDYCLYVPDCQGNVEGKYYNHTTSPKKTVKKLSKLMVNLWSVERVSCTMEGFECETMKKYRYNFWEDLDKWLVEEED